MTALILDSVGPNTGPARKAAARRTTTAAAESPMFVDQSSVYGRMQKTGGGKKPLWLLAPIAIVAVGGILFMTSQHNSARDTLTTTTTTQRVASNEVLPVTPVPAPASVIAPTAPPAQVSGERLAALDRRPPAAPVRRAAPAPVPSIRAPENESPATGVTANVAAPVAPPAIEAPAVALAPPPEVTPGRDTNDQAQAAPAAPEVGPLAANPSPPAETLQQ